MSYGTNFLVYLVGLILSFSVVAWFVFYLYKNKLSKPATLAKKHVKKNREKIVEQIRSQQERAEQSPNEHLSLLASPSTSSIPRNLINRKAKPVISPPDAQLSDDSKSENSDSENESIGASGSGKKIGTKKLRKLELKKQKKEDREALELERAKQKKIDEEKYKAEQEKKEEEKIEEAKRIERELEEKKERERIEAEEYALLKADFSIEEEGQDKIDTLQEDFKNNFISHVKENKIVMVDELSSKFNLSIKECVNLLNELLHDSDNRLTGVLDDRGKFIYVTKQEYEAVAKFIQVRGKVSLKELSQNSSRLIQLNQNQIIENQC